MGYYDTPVSPGRTNRTRNANAEALVSLEMLREHVGLAPDDNSQDNIIQSALDAAIAQIEGMLHRSLVATDVQDFYSAGFYSLKLSEGDITPGSLEVMHMETGPIEAGDVTLDETVRPAVVHLDTTLHRTNFIVNPVRVSYTTPGYTSNARIRERIVQAIKTLVAASYQERTGNDMEAVLSTVHTLISAPLPSNAHT